MATTNNYYKIKHGLEAPSQDAIQVTESTRPTIRPSLSLDFANSKVLDPRITFARASTATYYDGKTVAKAEENLLYRSQDLSGDWLYTNNATYASNTVVAPDGTTTADTLTASGSSVLTGTPTQTYQFVSGTNALQYTMSVYAKAGVSSFMYVREYFSHLTEDVTWFDLVNGVIGTTHPDHTASIISAGNGWYRCIVTTTMNATRTQSLGFGISNFNGVYTISTNSSIYLWGAQLEQRSSVTAYQPTTTQPITNYIPVLQTADANVARFDHDPVTSESLGLLIEEQRTNLLLRSEEFDNVYWSKLDGSINSNTIVAPNGTLTGDLFIPNTVNTNHQVRNDSLTLSGTGNYTASIYVKPAGYTTFAIQMRVDGTNYLDVNFDLIAGTFTSPPSGTTASITNVDNGWYRCSFTVNATVTTSVRLRFIPNGTPIFAGDGYSGIYIWGAQLEAGGFSTSYIPTVASQVTRSVDSASMTGANFSSWYRQGEGTVYVESKATLPTTGALTVFLSSGISNYINTGQYTSSLARASYVVVNSVEQANLSFPVLSSGTFNKFSVAFQTNNVSGTINGQAVATDNNCLIPNVTSLTIGNNVINTQPLNGTIKKITYYPQRLSNEQLQGLTSS
jgi:hypothetical protein